MSMNLVEKQIDSEIVFFIYVRNQKFIELVTITTRTRQILIPNPLTNHKASFRI